MPKVKTSWKKGQSGNPNGAPQGAFSLTKIMKKKLAELQKDGKETRADELVDGILETAKKGDYKHRELVMKYIEGMPKQQVDVTTGGKPFIMPAEMLEKHDIDTNTKDSSKGQD